MSVFALASLAACGAPNPASESAIRTVDLPHTPVKWQSIGNCWLYAALGWVESKVLDQTNETMDLSETYLTYRYFEEQLTSRHLIAELTTGGNWRDSVRLMQKYGVMQEGDFIAAEEGVTFSKAQAQAVAYLNSSLASGRLSIDRSLTIVRAELDTAFGVQLDDVTSKIIRLETLGVAADIGRWNEIRWPTNWNTIPNEKQLPLDVNSQITAAQEQLLRRVMQALNDGHPVLINWWVDFNGLDATGTFDLSNVKRLGSGRQGYHSTVLEDYVVSGIDPTTGSRFYIGEGEATEADKDLARRYGNLEYFVVKNSWGGAERPDRPSYDRFGTKGYSRLNASYLFGWMRMEEAGSFTGAETGLTGFVLPPGY
jgi:hypothetical protein